MALGLVDDRHSILLVAMSALATASILFFGAKLAAASQRGGENIAYKLTEQEQEEAALVKSMMAAGDFYSAVVTRHGNLSVVLFEGPQSANQIEEDVAGNIAWLHGYDTLVYEYIPQQQNNQLLIVLVYDGLL
jgi:hypothetical protein